MLSTNFQKIISTSLICTAAILIVTATGVLQISEVQAGMITFIPDHYFGYVVVDRTIPKFVPLQIGLADQFEEQVYDVVKPIRMYNPVQKNKEPVTDTVTHLKAYKIKGPHIESPILILDNQFERRGIDAIKVHSLLVPTAKSHEGPPDLLIDTPVDHFKCYKITVGGSQPGPVGKRVKIFDPNFGEVRKVKVVVSKPLFCNPVAKFDPITGEPLSDIKNPDVHLTCYKVKPKGADLGHDRIKFDTNNQFGPEVLKTRAHDVPLKSGKILQHNLCVPTLKDSLPL